MFKKKDKRFIIKEGQTLGWSGLNIIVDTTTGVNYIMTPDLFSTAITPLLDKNGNIVIDEIPNPYR